MAADAEFTDEELIALGLSGAPGSDESPAEFLALIRWLLARGATVGELQAAATRGINHLFALRDELLYLGPATMTAAELAARFEVTVDQLDGWWRLLRLPELATAERRFTESDAALVRTARFYMRVMAQRHAADALRVIGTGMQQITAGLRDVWRIAVEPAAGERISSLEYSAVAEAMADDARQHLPPFLFALYWRHTAAAVAENPVDMDSYGTAEADITVVFVDLVDFARLAQRVDATELSSIVTAFEHGAYDAGDRYNGRVVKLLGDGAMLQFKTPRAAIDAARAFVSGHPELPPRRAAVATGRALSRQGDFFGPVVNLAARLASVAGPGQVVVDAEPEGIASERLDPVVLKGYDEPVTPFRLRV